MLSAVSDGLNYKSVYIILSCSYSIHKKNQVLFGCNLESDQIFPAFTLVYIILSCSLLLCAKTGPIWPQSQSWSNLPCMYINEHHFVIFPLNMRQKQSLFGCNLKSDQISSACKSVYIVLSSFHTLCSKKSSIWLKSKILSNFPCMYSCVHPKLLIPSFML